VSLWRAQLTLSAGLFEDATNYAQAGLLLNPSPQLALQLQILHIAPAAMRGSLSALQELKDLIAGLAEDTDPMVAARAHAYRAIGMTRAGHLDDATDAHLRALEIVEQAGLDGELPTFLLNAGTAYHRQGRLGLAREFYARGARLSNPLTRPSTRALLFANQANIDLVLARYIPASENIARANAIAENHHLHAVLAMCQTLQGDLQYARKDYSSAIQTYRAALQLQTSTSQRAELELALSQSHLSLGNLVEATHHLNSARKHIEDEKLTDHEPLHGMLRARLQWSDGSNLNTLGGIELFRRSLRSAYESGNHKLVLQQTPFLAAQLAREEMTELLHETAELAQGSRNAVAMGLTGELRRDFFAALPTIPVSLPAQPQNVPPTKNQLPDVDRFYRLLSFNEVILRARTLDALLPDALEIGLSLSGAERAFILLREDERFKIVASRDVNGEPIDTPHLSVSQTIAEEAARTGRTVLTLNAREDHRFNSALSVVDLELSSVLCVPIRDAGGLLGALYLDHRYRHGNFDGEVPRMMEAYGHQLAIALTNLRHIADLNEEREHLARLNSALDTLAAERAVLLEGLKEQVAQLHDEVQHERTRAQRPTIEGLIYVSRTMENLRDQVTRVARGDIAVVLHGESGVGKELIARAIHNESLRATKPFVALNCGAISETLMESELFGHVKGAFTGAESDRRGMFHAAHGGTLFLDEVAEMPIGMQVKLLRVLQDKMVRRVGSNTTEAVDVRVLAATHRDLKKMVREGSFREDLYYRVATLTLEIPPLRDRPEDIVPIAKHVLARANAESGRQVSLTTEAALTLTHADWPGNVRELENVLRAAAILSEDDRLRSSDLTPLIQNAEVSGTPHTTSHRSEKPKRGRKSKVTLKQVETALEQFAGDRDAAAENLGISLRTLFRVLAK
jgi:transcriptional regulator with GAF, ATPase, and Fis domain